MLPRNQAKKKFNPPHFLNNTFRQFNSNFNNNQIRNELTINVTNNEPRLVIVNQPKVHHNFHSHHHFHTQSRPQQIQNTKYSKQSHSKGFNRYKFFNNQTNKLKAPYNTTQYLMYDYSKRRGPLKDQQCPDEQQQFANDWNLAMNQSENEDECKFSVCRKRNEQDESMEHDGETRQENNADNCRLNGLKKSLSDLDLTSDHELSNFFSTSI